MAGAPNLPLDARPSGHRVKPDRVLKHGVLLLATLLALVPTLYMLMTSLKSEDEYTVNKVGLPRTIVFDHYDNVLFQSPFFAWMENSIILAAGAVILSTLVSCLGAYAIARMELAGACCSRSAPPSWPCPRW